jgi:hypothetical protein
MRRAIYSLAFFAVQILFWSCHPGGAEYANELDVVYTNYDKTYNFQSKGTYSLPDKVTKVTGEVGGPPEYVNDIYGVPILAEIDANMQALGWVKVDVNNNPDIQVLPGAWKTTTIVTGGYYGGYWCWYYPYYCGGGGWYYPYPAVSSYTTGSLVMTIVDPALESPDGNKRVVWTGAINGILDGTYTASRVTKGIDQAFAQSPYLVTQ